MRAVRDAGFGAEQARALVYLGLPHLSLPPLKKAQTREIRKADKREKDMEQAIERVDATEAARLLDLRRKASERALANERALLGDAEKTRDAELKLVRANRNGAMLLAVIGSNLLQSASAISRSLAEDAESGRLRSLSPKEKVSIVKNIAQVAKSTAEVSARAVQMERLLMGEPTAILGHTSATPTADMTPEEAEQWFNLASRAFARKRRKDNAIDVGPVDPDDLDASSVAS